MSNLKLDHHIGKIIVSIDLKIDLDDYDFIYLTFNDGTVVTIFDAERRCCEKRYMRTDDTLEEFAGAQFIGAEVRDAPSRLEGDKCHDVQFFVMHTDKGDITFSSHNLHNGYYSGFDLNSKEHMTRESEDSCALSELRAFLKDGETVEVIVFGNWGWGWEGDEPKEGGVPTNRRFIPLPLGEAAHYMTGWSFNGGFGGPDCYAVTIWTNSRIIFVHEYDGSTSLRSVPRYPVEHTPSLNGYV